MSTEPTNFADDEARSERFSTDIDRDYEWPTRSEADWEKYLDEEWQR